MVASPSSTDHCIMIPPQLERFQVLADQVTAKQVVVQDLRQQVADYETMIQDYCARYCKELGEAAEMQNVQQRKIERLESQIDQLQQLRAQVDQLQGELELAKVQVRESPYLRNFWYIVFQQSKLLMYCT